MGPTQPVVVQQNTKKDQALTLFQAGKLAKQLELYSSQRQLRQQQHLLARLMIYGHSHLTQHIRKLQRAQRFNFIRYLRRIDIQTMDLLYQNYIHKRLQTKKNQDGLNSYSKISYIDKKEQIQHKNKTSQSDQTSYRRMVRLGQVLLQKKKIAILIFIGGNSSRFFSKQYPHSKMKQFYTEQPNQKCLMEIKLDQINRICQKYGEQYVYIVHNEVNHKVLNQLLGKYKLFTARKMIQNQNWIVTISGKFCLKGKEEYQLYQSPSGCGDFINLTVRNKKVLEDMKDEGVEYIVSFGAQNILQNVVDPYAIGLAHSNKQMGAIYKCTYPENENESSKRIIFNKTTKQLEVKHIEHFLSNSEPSCVQIIKHSPIWTNSVIIRLQSLKEALENRMKKLSSIREVEQVYTVRKTKLTYYNPCEQIYQDNQYCYAFQREISDLLMVSGMKMQALMIPREDQYAPVLSINTEMIWRDAYQQYTMKNIKKQEFKNFDENSVIQLGRGRAKNHQKVHQFVKIQNKIVQDDPHLMTTQALSANKQEPYEQSIISTQKNQQQF